MRRYYAGLLTVALVLAGCGKGDDTKTASSTDTGESTAKATKGGKADKETSAAKVEGWGNVKGQVVFAGNPPEPAPINPDKDQAACTAHGPLHEQKLVVDKDTKGVRWAVVYLIDPKNPRAKLPIKPELTEIKKKTEQIDQPTCQFEPHVLAIREGQAVEVKNSADISHNTKLDGGSAANPISINEIIPPKKSKLLEKDKFKASTSPIKVSCNIHGWMGGYIRVFNHPYFAVTDEKGNFEIKDAPAGTWNLVVWQESKDGNVNGEKGQPITIKPGDTTTEKVEMKP